MMIYNGTAAYSDTRTYWCCMYRDENSRAETKSGPERNGLFPGALPLSSLLKYFWCSFVVAYGIPDPVHRQRFFIVIVALFDQGVLLLSTST
jgi:hypothetical protein